MDFISQAGNQAVAFFTNGGLSDLIANKDGKGLDFLSAGANAFTALSKFSAGLANKNEALLAADREKLGATQEILRGKQSGNEILDRMVDTLAKNRVIAAASGTSATIGTPAAIAADTRQRGERAIGIVQQNAALEWFTRKEAAASLRAKGKAIGLASLIDAGGTLLQGAAAAANRG